MSRQYDEKSARTVVLKSNATVDADKRITFTSGSLGLKVLGAISYLSRIHGYKVSSK